MVKITHEPFEEVVIKECVHYERIEDLVYMVAQLRLSGAPVALNWASGLVFFHADLFPETDKLAEEFLRGKIYWTNVSFAIMPEYKPQIETREKIPVPIINQSSNPTMKQVAEWLRRQNPKE